MMQDGVRVGNLFTQPVSAVALNTLTGRIFDRDRSNHHSAMDRCGNFQYTALPGVNLPRFARKILR